MPQASSTVQDAARTAKYYLTHLHRARPRHVPLVAGRALRRWQSSRLPTPAAPGDTAISSGLVEEFSRGRIEGWVVVPRNAPAVRVEVWLNDIPATAAWATGMSDRSTDLASWGEVRTFRFFLKDLWRFARTTDRISVRADGVALPIHEVGMFFTPKTNGAANPNRLVTRLAEGYVFEQYGKLALSKQYDTAWQERVMSLFADVRSFVKDRFGHDLFFFYGTLLGAVRDNGFIGHDIDLDSAFLSDKRTGREAAQELRDIAFALIDAGYQIESFRTHLHITDANGTRIDLFHVYFDADDQLALSFGSAGTSRLNRGQWRGVREIDFPGGTGAVPVVGEELVAHLYGDDWRRPKPGFHWPKDRTRRKREGIMPPEMHEEIYWANFYAHTSYDKGSTFFDLVNAREDTPQFVIDIGCGDGRDTFSFGLAGRSALGLDRSHIGVQHAAKKAASMGLGERVDFRAVDVSHVDQLRETLSTALAEHGDTPALFYMRFFLHSIPADVQDGLMKVIDSVARPGDMLAAEFRTDKDEALAKVHTKHYRRYQNGPAYGEALRTDYGFEPIFTDQGTGMSPYGDEDPELYRVIARRSR